MFPVLSGDGGKKSKKKDGKARASGTGSGSPVWGRRAASGGGSWPGLSSKGEGAKRDEVKTNKPSGGGAAAVRAPMGPDSSSGFAGASTAGRGRGRGRGNSGRSRGQSIGVGGGFAPAPSGSLTEYNQALVDCADALAVSIVDVRDSVEEPSLPEGQLNIRLAIGLAAKVTKHPMYAF